MPTKHELIFIKRRLVISLLAADEASRDRQFTAMDELLDDARRLRRILLEIQEGQQNAEAKTRDSGKPKSAKP